jgi:pimeloyl-ACP methyl ester carboxylesterase
MSAKRRSSSSSTLACPACGLEHPADERFCRDCGMPLVKEGDEEPVRDAAHERARKIHPEYTHGALARVAGGRNQAEAELIQNILLEEGVPSVLRRSAGFDVPDFLAAGPRDVLVPESGYQAAREALHSADSEPAPVDSCGPTPMLALWISVALVGMALLAALVAWAITQG